MCYEIIEQYGCGHEYLIKTKCKDEYAECHAHSNHRQFSVKPAKQGLLMKHFRSSSSSTKDPRYKTMDSICQDCQRKDDEKRAQSQYNAPYDLADVRAQQVLKATKAVKAGRYQFLCTKCTREGRHLTYGAQRAANNGLCCDNGRREFENHEKLARSSRSPPCVPPKDSLPARPARANSTPARSASTTAARQAASQASEGYGWSRDQAMPGRAHTTREKREAKAIEFNPERAGLRVQNRDSVHPERKLAHDFGSLPGYALPEQRTEQGTYYEPAQIDFDRWGDHLQTHHGRIPGAPEQALPKTPQRGSDLIPRKLVPQTPRSHSHSRSPPKASTKASRPTGSQFSSSRQEAPSREQQRQNPRPTDREHQTQAEQLSHNPPRSQYHAAPRALRSTRGKEWRDSADLAARSPDADTTFHRLASSFDHEPPGDEQDIASISRFSQPYNPVSPLHASRLPDFDAEIAPLSFGKKTASFGTRREEAGRALSSQEELDRAMAEAFEAAEYWEWDLKRVPSRRER